MRDHEETQGPFVLTVIASRGSAVRHLARLRALARDVDDLEFHRVVDPKTAGLRA